MNEIAGQPTPIEQSSHHDTLPLNEKAVVDFIKQLSISDADQKEIISRIIGWVQDDPQRRTKFIEDAVSESLADATDINFNILTLLSEVNSSRKSIFVSDRFAEKMELGERGINQELKEQITLLNRVNDEKANFLLHKILDYFHQYMLTVQDHTERELEDRGIEYNGGLFMDFLAFAKKETRHSKNYLVKQHWQDIIELLQMFDSKKEGAISGFPGGASDETIYVFSHLKESDENRRALGFNQGYPIANPVLPIAKGYLGLYKMGRLSEVYRSQDCDFDSAREREQKHIENNDPESDYIYEIINQAVVLEGPRASESNKLRKLQDFWDFYDEIRQRKEEFYFDTSQINMDELHPVVRAEVFTHNQKHINEMEKGEDSARPVANDEYKKLLFPLGNFSPEKFYSQNYLMSLAMRKRVEDEFKFKVEELGFWEQRMFLSFLERADEETLKRMKKLVAKYGKEAVKVFLSLEDGEDAGQIIFRIAEELPDKIGSAIFKKYSEIVAQTENIADYIREQFGKDADEKEILKITQTVLRRGNELLKKSFELPAASDDLMNQLEEIQSNTVLFASSFKTLFKGRDKIDFSEVRGLDFQRQPISWLSDQDKSEMLAIAKSNWRPRGKAGEGVIGEFGETLKHGQDIDFYILRRDGKIISFVRFDAPTPEGHRYAGSFNVDQQYRGSAIGEAMIYNALDKQAEKYILDATVYPKLDVGTKYVEQTGFAITNVLHNYDNSGEDFFEITCDRRKNKKIVSREARKETLMALASTESKKNWRELVGQNLIVLKFDVEREHEQVLQTTEGLISDGYVGTRYFADPSDKKKRFYVFEVDKKQERAELKEAVG